MDRTFTNTVTMDVLNDIPLRSSRNRLLGMLFPVGLSSDPADLFTIAPADPVFPYPLRDLSVCYSPNITLGKIGVIFIIGAEKDEEVDYVLVDENEADNNEIAGTPLNLESDAAFTTFIQELEGRTKGWKVFTNGSLDSSLEEFKKTLEDRLFLVEFIKTLEPEDTITLTTLKSSLGDNPILKTLKTALSDNPSLNEVKTALKANLSLEIFKKTIDLIDSLAVFVTSAFKDTISEAFKNKWWSVVQFTTSPITQDESFSIRATNKKTRLKVLLASKINYRTKIDPNLDITLIDTENPNTVLAGTIVVDTIGRFEVKIAGSQKKVHYQLIRITGTDAEGKPSWEKRSERFPGNGNDHFIPIPADAQPEDQAEWGVRASRDLADSISKDLEDNIFFEEVVMPVRFTISIPIYPNVTFAFEDTAERTTAIAYTTASEPKPSTSNVKISQPQKGVTYKLFARTLEAPQNGPADYEPNGDLLKTREELLRTQQSVEISTFNLTDIDNKKVGLTPATGELLEKDSLLIIKAEHNGAEIELEDHLVALVRPDPGIQLRSALDFLRLINAQSGAGYQLREANPPFTEIGPVLYTEATGIGREVTDREGHSRVFGMQINGRDVDFPGDAPQPSGNYFKIEKAEENKFLEFRTADIEKEKIYEILAIKEYTGLTEVLSHGIKITEEGAEIIPTE